MGQVFCPQCGQGVFPGTLICDQCNALIDGEEVAPGLIIDAIVPENGPDPVVDLLGQPALVEPAQPDPPQAPVMVTVQPLVRLALLRINDRTFASPETHQIFHVPIKNGLVWIGRADPTKRPPFIPDVDFSSLFAVHLVGDQPPVSRRQASLRWENNRPVLKAGGRAGTWHQHGGSGQIRAIMSYCEVTLQDRDVIIFGYPTAAHIAFRVEFH